MKLIQLSNHPGSILVDDEDYSRLNLYNWSIMIGTAVQIHSRINKNKVTLISRFILNYDGPLEVDHKDRNPFNNQKLNLRLATKSQNMMNTNKRKNTSSIYKGVSWSKEKNKFEAYIQIDGKRKNLGRYDSEKTAAIAYNIAAVEYYKEFAVLNEF